MPSLVSSHTDCHKKYNLRVPTVKQRDYFGSYLLCDSRKIYSFHNLHRCKEEILFWRLIYIYLAFKFL